MRTTIDIPDELYRSLKARAALGGEPLRDIVTRLIHLGLRADPSDVVPRNPRRGLPPVAIPPSGTAIPALSHAGKARAEEAEDEAKLARSA
jgi:negative regulator of replication initiation